MGSTAHNLQGNCVRTAHDNKDRMLYVTLVAVQQMLVTFHSFFPANILSASKQKGHSQIWKKYSLLPVSVAA